MWNCLPTPQVCFFDDGGIYVAKRIAARGDAYIYAWDSNDFIQVKPDGTIFAIATDVNVYLWVCPVLAGGEQCLEDFWAQFPSSAERRVG